MKSFKKLNLLLIFLMCAILLGACSPRNPNTNENISERELENMPTDQKETEIDKKVSETRKDRKNGRKEENGSLTIVESIDNGIKGMSSNVPDFDGDYRPILEVADEYILKVLKNPIRINDEYKFDSAFCIDPRINEIYNDSDKGFLKGYENENIAVIEYEEENGEYSYLFLGRKSKGEAWEVIHNGKNYK